jgi:hypothetical protein
VKGVSASLVSALLLIITIASVSILYNQIGRISTGAASHGQDELVDVSIAPKLLAVYCQDGYGYFYVSSDEPLQGTLYYTVNEGLDEVASGFATANVTEAGKIYFNASMAAGNEYTVYLRSSHWTLREHCTSQG